MSASTYPVAPGRSLRLAPAPPFDRWVGAGLTVIGVFVWAILIPLELAVYVV
jgi:hypothetical protein